MSRIVLVLLLALLTYFIYSFVAMTFNASDGNMALIVVSVLVADMCIPKKDKHD